ncbi:MAG TPA: hypothetical protein VG326_19240 [Tepidisphaeraceae bacterium]|jgi:hypothetical protein|nr:hypothetical protein [Tepidisphaeraceae bacterium]
MDVAIAEFVRWIDRSEPSAELINDAKALTWEHDREHAVLEVSGDRRVLMRGGPLGIEFVVAAGEPYDSFGKPRGDFS